MLELLSQPWPWYVVGPLISINMFLLLYFGKNFGVSANLRTMCALSGGGRLAEFFNFDWRSQTWNLLFAIGAVTGGYIASTYLMDHQPLEVSSNVINELKGLGILSAGQELLPQELFSFESLFTLRGIIMLGLGGFLVGFGARYAGGCTSGHAISGLSDLQIPSLIAVVGFFIGGLLMTFLILPYILQL